MAFPTKVIPFSVACKTWLDNTYAAKNHNHDTVYSKLGHTHTDIGFKYPDYKNAKITMGNLYSLYRTKADGYIRFAANSGRTHAILTNRISEFDSRINNYQFNGSDYNGYEMGALVKYNNSYYQCKKNFTNTEKIPGVATDYWGSVSTWVPVIMHTVTSYTSDGDSGLGSLLIPVKNGTFIMGVITLDVGRQRIISLGQSEISGEGSSMWFVPFEGNSGAPALEPVLRSDGTQYTMTYNSFKWDIFLLTLSGLFRSLKIAKS